MFPKKRIFLFLFLCLTFCAYSQNNRDSLLSVYTKSKDDSVRFKAIDDYIWEHMYVNPDEAFELTARYFKQNINSSYKKGLSLLLRTAGASFVIRGNNEQGVFFYTLSAKLSEVLKDDEGLASAYNGLGIIYSRESNYSSAIEQYLHSLSVYERLMDEEGMSIAYNNIGLNYERQNQFEKAKESYEKCLRLKIKIGKPLGIAQAKINLGNVYSNRKDYTTALQLYNDALLLQKELNNPLLEAAINNSVGVIYLDQKQYAPALNYFMKALVLRIKMDDKYGAVDIRNNLAIINNAEKNYDKAIEYALEAHNAAVEMHNMQMIKETSKTLNVAYENKGNVTEAYHYFKIYDAYKDSVYNKEETEKSIQAELRYEFAKQEEKNKLELQKKEFEQKESTKRQVIVRNFFIVGFLFLLIFAFLIFRNLKQKQKANKELEFAYKQVEDKSNLLETKNKEVTDSIKYAKRLQEAILPSADFIKKLFPESFVLYKPKDIVSGDFYWFEQLSGKKMFAAVDCTGHGVPGAFMSIVGYNLLNQSVNEHRLTTPSLILNELNKGITKTLKQTFEESTVKDGMDIALCSYDEQTNMLEYAGAYNSLWHFRDNEVKEFAADKHPIGLFVGEELKQFQNHTIPVLRGDTVYIFTDGFADQFGGPKGKKFKYKKLQELLLSIQNKTLDEQHQILDSTFENWKGNLEQIDDILIIGIRLT